MAAMYFSPKENATIKEASDALRAAAHKLEAQVEGHIQVEEQEEVYSGSGPIEASGSPENLDTLKKLADKEDLRVKAERLDYEPLESGQVNEIFVEGYFES